MPKGQSELNNMNPDSRIWIFQSDRLLSQSEKQLIFSQVSEFLSDWKAHGNDLMAGATIQKMQFLMIALDESYSEASGCSIDACIRKIQEVGRMYNVDFFNRSNVAIQSIEDNSIKLFQMNDLARAMKEGEIQPEDMVFNNTIQKLSDLKELWLTPARESWIKRYFK